MTVNLWEVQVCPLDYKDFLIAFNLAPIFTTSCQHYIFELKLFWEAFIISKKYLHVPEETNMFYRCLLVPRSLEFIWNVEALCTALTGHSSNLLFHFLSGNSEFFISLFCEFFIFSKRWQNLLIGFDWN